MKKNSEKDLIDFILNIFKNSKPNATVTRASEIQNNSRNSSIIDITNQTQTIDNDLVRTTAKENTYQNFYATYTPSQLGDIYKTKLKLNEEEVKLVNKIPFPNNIFLGIEFCLLEVIKLYILVIAELKAKYIAEKTTLDREFSSVADVIAKKYYNYRRGSRNYQNAIATHTDEFYLNIFRQCENTARELYGSKRKTNANPQYYSNKEIQNKVETTINSKVLNLLPSLAARVAPPDQITETELYAQNTSRWKTKFNDLTANYANNPTAFVEAIIQLGELNKKNPMMKNIFFDAATFMVKIDKIVSLSFYVHYLYYDLKSNNFGDKKLTKTAYKILFNTQEQLEDFENIVSVLKKDENLNKALADVAKIYEIKRKKIQLNTAAIKDVEQQHSGTVELLNKYLADEVDIECKEITSTEIKEEIKINSQEIKLEVAQDNKETSHLAFLGELSLQPIQIAILELFSKNNLSVLQNEVEDFARAKGVFKNQLIASINENCYELLDDVLIEEEDNYYTINPAYFQKILVN